jgi:hypothetical protein
MIGKGNYQLEKIGMFAIIKFLQGLEMFLQNHHEAKTSEGDVHGSFSRASASCVLLPQVA